MLKARGFVNLRQWTHGVDTELFSYHSQPKSYAPLSELIRPLSLFVGRVSYEKSIESFLALSIPGTKVICGVGPLEASLKKKYPHVTWLGLLARDELAKVYAAADVFVFPSKSETFGLVLLEAMACGTPVAAYPVDGPLEVLCDVDGKPQGGVLDADLLSATNLALGLPRYEARQRAIQFSWQNAAKLFENNLMFAKTGRFTQVNRTILTNYDAASSDSVFKT
jgi:glycosyltransferase involved in cell wall biosynthesis